MCDKLSERSHYCTHCDHTHGELLRQSLKALRKAQETIEALHGEPAWEIYNTQSPEMKLINGTEKELRYLLED